MDLLSKIGKKLSKPHRKRLEAFYDSYYPGIHYILRGHLSRVVATKKYLKNNQVPKLQIGCGHNLLDGWLNADIVSGEIYLNAERKLPFKDNTFGYVFCEHLLEHLSLKCGSRFLKECHRILKKGGIIRITTPDLEKLIDLCFDEQSLVRRQDLIKTVYSKEISPCELFNNYWNRWGHRFIYDKGFLRSSLYRIGFTGVTFCENTKSSHVELANVEKHPVLINLAEALTVEATK